MRNFVVTSFGGLTPILLLATGVRGDVPSSNPQHSEKVTASLQNLSPTPRFENHSFAFDRKSSDAHLYGTERLGIREYTLISR